MKKYAYIIFTAGRGPEECGLAVFGIQNRFREFLIKKNIPIEVVIEKPGRYSNSLETILFRMEKKFSKQINPWIGTLKWICKSPIRKSSKRNNWYIKCFEIEMPTTQPIDINDIQVKAYKASGPGGQHRNKVETAIRITHLPTGIVVTASDSKSKYQNKKNALIKLKTVLNENQTRKIQYNEENTWSSKIDIERGNPIKVFKGLKFKDQ